MFKNSLRIIPLLLAHEGQMSLISQGLPLGIKQGLTLHVREEFLFTTFQMHQHSPTISPPRINPHSAVRIPWFQEKKKNKNKTLQRQVLNSSDEVMKATLCWPCSWLLLTQVNLLRHITLIEFTEFRFVQDPSLISLDFSCDFSMQWTAPALTTRSTFL